MKLSLVPFRPAGPGPSFRIRPLSAKVLFLAIAVLLLAGPGTLLPAMAEDDPEARAIMEKVDAREDGDNMKADMRMILIDKNQKKRERFMRTYAKDKGEDTYRLIFFTDPPAVRGTGFLTYDYDDPDKDDDQWLYLPALKTTKRIASSDKTDAFMGSDFSYADMTTSEVENYTYKLLKTDTVYNHKVWLIESIPVDQHVIDTFGYDKSVVFVRQDNYVIVRAVLWVTGSDKIKYMDVKKLDQVDGIWVPAETHMTTKRGRNTLHKTILTRENIRFNQDLDDSLFTVRSLEKGL
ncbi:MAG: outer membrane lipoprotein-sorting protein [Desulfosudaceae bacterium]